MIKVAGGIASSALQEINNNENGSQTLTVQPQNLRTAIELTCIPQKDQSEHKWN